MKGVPGEIYNVCSGAPRTIRSVLEDLIRESGKKLSIESDPSLLKERDIDSIYGDSTKYDQFAR
jgi:nucleoside-diphosphate-sugar epimerase